MKGRRLFFALWPDAALREGIALAARTAARAAGIEGRRMRDENLHLTLLFLGEVEAAVEARAIEAAAGVRGERFELALDQAGSFYRAKVLWIGASQPPAPLTDLWLRLRTALDGAGVPFDRKALAAHVTCYRDIRRFLKPAALAEPLRWPVRSFALILSTPAAGGQYHVVSQWPLQTASVTNVKTVQAPGGTE